MDIATLYAHFRASTGVLTDTRRITPGGIFFALKGANFNGNRFAAAALEAGARLAVVDEEPETADARFVVVQDALTALQDLALHHRRRFDIPVLAITGSNGKTTTKELVHAVLSRRFRTHTTRGNLNNHIGIPLTLLEMPDDTQMAVVEMGANHQREIAGYCTYAEPTHGIITNCGKAHLEGFGGVEGVRKGKGELYDHLRAHGGTAFVMRDYAYLRDMCRGIPRCVTYGTSDADVTGHALRSEPYLEVRMDDAEGGSIATRLVGDYNLPNVLVTVAVGRHFGVPERHIAEAIAAYTPSNSRSQLVERHGNRIILDAYNANPTSMRAAIENLARQPHPRKMVFIGGMMELGKESAAEHASIVSLLQRHEWAEVILVGGDFGTMDHPYRYFPDAEAAAAWLLQHRFTDALLLLKGSRSMRMERLLEAL